MVGDNKDELAQRLEETANRLLAVERTVVSGVPKAAEEAMENLKSYVAKRYHKEHVTNDSQSRILAKEMKELQDLADKSLVTRILDLEAYRSKILQIFQRVNEAAMSFLVRTAIIFIQSLRIFKLVVPS